MSYPLGIIKRVLIGADFPLSLALPYYSILKFFSFDKMGGLKVAESAGRIRDFAFA